MRAVYLENIIEEKISIVDEKFHHFKNVLRLKENTEILCLNGKGQSRKFIISQLKKREIELDSVSPVVEHTRKNDLNLAIACIKKDALDLSLRMATELGIKKITILETDYSQRYKLNLERINSILVSSIEQSNSPFIPEIELSTLKEFLEKNKKIIYLTVKDRENKNVDNLNNYTLLVGPEAGFSESEDKLICQKIETYNLHLKTNILRAQTAVAAGIGFALSKQNNIEA